jgi:lipoate-protein ligase A
MQGVDHPDDYGRRVATVDALGCRVVRRTVRLVTEGFPDRPRYDAAVSLALLRRAASGAAPETFRLYVPGRSVQFGRMDTSRPGYADAVAAAEGLGFTPVVRLAGGRAAVFHESTLAFAWIVPEPRDARSIDQRFEELAEVMVDAFGSLGADARIGEIPGEYCPGTYSVNLGGVRKVMGVGQRLVRGAAHIGGVVVVDGHDLVNRVLAPVYGALGYDWDPAATGSLAEAVDVEASQVANALLAALATRHVVIPGSLDADTLAEAQRMAAAGPGR